MSAWGTVTPTLSSTVDQPYWSDEFTTYNDTATWWPNLPYFGPSTGAKDPAGLSWNAWQGENMNGSIVSPFSIISDAGATDGKALRITLRKTAPVEAAYIAAHGQSGETTQWVGGVTTTRTNFTFSNSIYIEYRARIEGQGVGMFPALWIDDVSTDGGGVSENPPLQQGAEIDMLEDFGVPEGSPNYSWATSVWYEDSATQSSRSSVNAGHATTDIAG